MADCMQQFLCQAQCYAVTVRASSDEFLRMRGIVAPLWERSLAHVVEYILHLSYHT
jgi:hypothetical protein